jgi:hypothetical protein
MSGFEGLAAYVETKHALYTCIADLEMLEGYLERNQADGRIRAISAALQRLEQAHEGLRRLERLARGSNGE